MSDLPPPPSTSVPAPAPSSPTLESMTLDAGAPFAGPTHAVSRLTFGWRWLLAIAWAIVMAAMGAIAQSAFTVDSGPFWLSVKPLPFAAPVAVLIALAYNWRGTIAVSGLATLVTAAIAVGDVLAGHVPVGLAEGVCALAALIVTAAGALATPRTNGP